MSQQTQIEAFRRYLEGSMSAHAVKEHGAAITKFEVTTTDYGVQWISAVIDYAGLSETNLLRALSREFWLVMVGKRGALTVKMAPKSMHQFAGKRAMQLFTVAKDVA